MLKILVVFYCLALLFAVPGTAHAYPDANTGNLNLQFLVGGVAGLALVHHMVISANVPLAEFIDWLARLRSHLVIEFVTRDDAIVQRLLLNKDDIYHDYHLDGFEREIDRRFETLAREELGSGTRFLYFLRAK